METVHVDLGTRSYDILIGSQLLQTAGARMAPFLHRPKIAVITDENVAAAHLDTLKASCVAEGIDVVSLTLPAGEQTKSWEKVGLAVEWLLSQQIERDDTVVAFGGGVIGDLAGFAAAILRRGVKFIQIPTSLLAQVDSSVGGKTGINSPHGKNLIGAFYQPQLVLADIDVLEALDQRQFLAGYAEVAKYGLLGSYSFFEWLEENGAAMAAGDAGKRMHAIKISCQMKADIVVRDEQERGDRALLNLGHTFGHALESATGYSDLLLHGEGVSIGCGLAFEVSQRMGLCTQELPSRVQEHFASMGMKSRLSDISGDLPDVDGLMALMQQDKKVQAGKIAFILARDIGETYVERSADMDVVKAVLRDALAVR